MTATLPRPGYGVSSGSAPAQPNPPVNTGRWFVSGLTPKGPLSGITVASLGQFEAIYGTRVSYGILYDCLDEYFSDGGIEAIIGRVVGPLAKVASHTLEDLSAGESLVAKAKGPGEYGNAIKVKVTKTAETFVIEILEGAVVLEVSPTFTTQAGAIFWASVASSYIELTLGASSLIPKTQEQTLAGGADDRAKIADEQWRAAQNLFTKEMGPGQLSQAGRTTSQAYIDQLAHAVANNRFALLDAPASNTGSTLTAAALALRGTNDTYGMMLGRYPTINGVVPGVPREIPPSAFAAAFMARNDAAGNSPNKPAAAANGRSVRGISLTQPPYQNGALSIEETRDEMYSKGINLFTIDQGAVELLGYRTLTDPNGALADWINAANARLRMAIVAKIGVIAKGFVLDEIDGSGNTLKEFEGQIKGMLSEYYRMGSLFGEKPEDAFIVNVGPSVNTPATLANLEMRAEVGLRMSPDAEMVFVTVAKVPITQQLA